MSDPLTDREIARIRECWPRIEYMLSEDERNADNRRALWLAAAKWLIGAVLAALSASLIIGFRAWIDGGIP